MKHSKLFVLVVILFLTSCATPIPPENTPTNTPLPTATQTQTATSTPTKTPTITPTITPVPTQVGGGSGKLVFSYYREGGYENLFPELEGELNVFTANWDGTDLTPITNGLNGYNHYKGISPDGQKMLVVSQPQLKWNFTADASKGDLYIIYLDNSKEPQKIASGLYYANAKWINDTSIAFVARIEQTRGVYVVNSDGTDLRRISKYVDGVFPIWILPSSDPTRVYWEGYSVEGIGVRLRGTWWSNVDGSAQSILSPAEVSVSPDGSMVVWNKPVNYAAECCYINISAISEMSIPQSKWVRSNNYSIKWSPDSTKVLLYLRASERSGKFYPYSAFILSPQDFTFTEISLPIPDDVVTRFNFGDWSPDGRQILVYDDGAIKFFNMETMTLSEGFLLSETRGVYWLPNTN